MKQFGDRVAVVTGAASGIGLALAERFAAEGMKVVMADIETDALATAADAPSLAAMGFLTVGRRFLGNPHDIIDDRLDVLTRGTMALTVTCARCHDHKYDPIPTKEYYSLYGVLASSVEPAQPADVMTLADAERPADDPAT